MFKSKLGFLAVVGLFSSGAAGCGELGTDPRGVSVSPDGRTLHIAHAAPGRVTVVGIPRGGPATRRNLLERSLANHPGAPFTTANPLELSPSRAMAIVQSPSGRRIYVPHVVCDEEAPRAGGGGAAYYGGGMRPAIKPVVSVFDPSSGLIDPMAGVPIESAFEAPLSIGVVTAGIVDAANLPSGAAHHPTKSLLLVAMQGTDNVVAYSTAADAASFATLGVTKVSDGPKGIVISNDGRLAYVHGEFDRRIDVLQVDGGGISSDYFVAWRIRLPPSERSAGWGLGRRLFHAARDPRMVSSRHVACAGCHIEGRTDRLVWAFAPDGRNAPVLAGRLTDTGPFNWDGDKEDLSENIRRSVRRMGGTGLSASEVAALTEYVETGLPLPRNPWPERHRSNGVGVEEGRAIFDSAEAGCSGCHSGPAYTDRARHRLGPGDDPERDLRLPKIDTPSLIGLWASAPYFHDGRYADLRQLLTDRRLHMGSTGHLDQGRVGALIAYLQTL